DLPEEEESPPDTSDLESIELDLPEDAEAQPSELLETEEEPQEEPPAATELGGEPEIAEETGAESAAQAEGGEPRGPASAAELPENLKQEIRSVLSYMDQLLESLPEEKIEEFARSEHFEVYKRLFEELGLESE
ncbi:MAG: hypothetical protein ACLFM6_09970, partial [Spirochaetaceae bacterium]